VGALENLKQLRARGATVLYGTDFGNTVLPGIQPTELGALTSAGLDTAALIAAGTTEPRALLEPARARRSRRRSASCYFAPGPRRAPRNPAYK
jgi:imidazolonepropionase-like amidohydrolase